MRNVLSFPLVSRVTLLLSLIAFLLVAQTATADDIAPPPSTPSYSAVLLKDLVEMNPVGNFNCLDRVYVYLTWYNIPGTHRVTALWFNPQGQQQDAHDLDFEGGKEVACWLALEFLNVASPSNPMVPNTSAAKFNGPWKVKLLLDGQELETQTFNVKCG